MFQDYEISLSEKKILTFESRYRNEIPKAETPLCMLSEKADSPCLDRMARGRSLGVSLRYESTNRG